MRPIFKQMIQQWVLWPFFVSSVYDSYICAKKEKKLSFCQQTYKCKTRRRWNKQNIRYYEKTKYGCAWTEQRRKKTAKTITDKQIHKWAHMHTHPHSQTLSILFFVFCLLNICRKKERKYDWLENLSFIGQNLPLTEAIMQKFEPNFSFHYSFFNFNKLLSISSNQSASPTNIKQLIEPVIATRLR